MLRVLLLFAPVLLLPLLGGCALSSLFGSQSWSENYALLPGVQATSPAMVDGDLKTVGETTLPPGAENAYGMTGAQEAIITLPEVKNIYRVVIYSDNIKTLKVFADKGDEDWIPVKDIKAVKSSPIDVRFAARTDKIRIQVLATTDDGELRRQQTARGGWGRTRRGSRIAPGKIAEVEIYGYASQEELAQKQQETSAEEELDQLLSQ